MSLRSLCLAASALFLLPADPASAQPASGPQKVIFDTDFSSFNDDGQSLILAAREHKAGRIKLMGVTLVAGNSWIEEQRVHALKSVERVGLEKEVAVFSGAEKPLLHDFNSFEQEKALLGVGDGYYGAWSQPRPNSDSEAESPPDGRAERSTIQEQHAVDFIIDTVRANPRQVTLLVIGPVTNIALAVRKAPDIVPLIGRIVYMGGAFDVPGNTMPAAEFNVWFDPEAAKIVYREPIEQIFIPLDVTNTARLPLDFFDPIVKANPDIAKLYRPMPANPNRPPRKYIPFWDQLAMAYVIDPTFATEVQERWFDVDTNLGLNYGRTMSYTNEFPGGSFLQKGKIVTKFDINRFKKYYTDSMMKPLSGK